MSSSWRRAAAFALLLLWCGTLIVVGNARSRTGVFSYLLWNLFLAVIPAVAAAVFEAKNRRQRSPAIQAILIVTWLLFLPNAPYIVTDFVHLAPAPGVPLWYDIAVLVSCAATGLLLGYASVADVQTAVTRNWGRAAGWLVAMASLLLGGFGIYLGRFVRWNSWDAFARPKEIVGYIAPRATEPLAHTRSLGVTAIYGAGLLVGYIALRIFATTTARRDPVRPREAGRSSGLRGTGVSAGSPQIPPR